MKKFIYLIILTFGILSCNSDDETQDEVQIDISDLIGKWNWNSTCGGITGACGYANEENFHTIEFIDDTSFIKITNGTITTNYTYSIIEFTIDDLYKTYKILLDNGDIYFYRIKEDKLWIHGGEITWLYDKMID
ncbi:MAG: hypothetical protein IMY67_06325 [Bacteroidetes bacterium]|nr:hypothetical protein [Bacteroidota bacterium]